MEKIYHYFVEGECEQKLINTLKAGPNSLIIPGKVTVFNVQIEHFTDLMIRTLKTGTILILVFDTDAPNSNILDSNIRKLKDSGFKTIWCIMQDKNLEDELIKSTNINKITELLNTKSKKEFKKALIKEKQLMTKLNDHGFDIEKMWVSKSKTPYKNIENNSQKIKIKSKR